MEPEKMPLVSVLMTSYNREKYIAEAIESVLNSTYKNFELIIVDDGSNDDTVKIASTFAAKDSRIKLYINDKNLGDYPNRNKAASYAIGKYLKYLDSDDIIYKYSLAIMVEAMEKFPTAAYAFSNYPNQDNRGVFPLLFTSRQCYFEHFFKHGFFYAGPSSSIILKSAFEEVGGFSGIRFVGDYELWLKLAGKYSVIKIQPNLIWWRVHEGQESTILHHAIIHAKHSYSVTIKALENADCPLPNNLKSEAIKKNKSAQSRSVIRLFFKGKIALAIEVLKSSKLNMLDLLQCLFPFNLAAI